MNAILEQRFRDNPYLREKIGLGVVQENQLQAFLKRGLPTRSEEHWKYTDVSYLQNLAWDWSKPVEKANKISLNASSISCVFVDGYFNRALSDLRLLPTGVILCPLSEALQQHANLIKPYVLREFDTERSPFASLNTALMTDGFFLQVPKNTCVTVPVHFIFISTKASGFTCPRNIVLAETHSQVTLVEEYVSQEKTEYVTNSLTVLRLAENANVHYHKIQSESFDATHLANAFVLQEQNSILKSFYFANGSRLAREDVEIALSAKGAECHVAGLYHLTADGQHVDYHVHIDHLTQQGTSNLFFKGLLDKKSHAVFNGKVFVHKGAQKTVAQQANHNLLLSKDAQVDTKPELEIYADDVKCAHGATVGQLDSSALFYLQARGISKDEALSLLTRAFADEALNRVENSEIKTYMQQRVHGDANL